VNSQGYRKKKKSPFFGGRNKKEAGNSNGMFVVEGRYVKGKIHAQSSKWSGVGW